jgi:hypothetical protein
MPPPSRARKRAPPKQSAEAREALLARKIALKQTAETRHLAPGEYAWVNQTSPELTEEQRLTQRSGAAQHRHRKGR